MRATTETMQKSLYQSRYKKGEAIIIFSVFQCRVYDIDRKKQLCSFKKLHFYELLKTGHARSHFS